MGDFGVKNLFGHTTYAFDGDEVQEIPSHLANEIGSSSKGKRKVNFKKHTCFF